MAETSTAEDLAMLGDNVIQAYFGSASYEIIYRMIKFEGGTLVTEKALLDSGQHPSFVKAVIKKICRERGW